MKDNVKLGNEATMSLRARELKQMLKTKADEVKQQFN